ncbi:MAG: hypothetical protein Q9M29_04505 [Mariprofundaceae bacterium]|nr:hypothetical protein [Mariprofundaceae bacterium]
MAGVSGGCLLVLAWACCAPACAAEASQEVAGASRGLHVLITEAPDAELLAFVADWVDDDGECIDPESLPGHEGPPKESEHDHH